MKLLNIGCGSTFHPNWINIDIAPTSSEVREWNLHHGLPFNRHEIDVCYMSHVLEHLPQKNAEKLINDCFRILKPTGIIRVVVPDLESIARIYLGCLEEADKGIPKASSNYDWMMLELYDQSIRTVMGGEMGNYLSKNLVDSEFIRSRLGLEFDQVIENIKVKSRKTFLQKVKDKGFIDLLKTVRIEIAKTVVGWILGKQGQQALSEGLFRQSGEIHLWMYDRFSLRRLLEESGFSSVQICNAYESSIPNFSIYQLDVVKDQLRKPDSLFIEGIKP